MPIQYRTYLLISHMTSSVSSPRYYSPQKLTAHIREINRKSYLPANLRGRAILAAENSQTHGQSLPNSVLRPEQGLQLSLILTGA